MGKGNEDEKGLRGSFTVEAAIVLPMIVYVLLLIVYGAFYLYSSYTLSLHAYISVFRGSRANLLQRNAYQITEQSMQTFVQEELPAVTKIRYETAADMWDNEIEVSAEMRIPFAQSVIQKLFAMKINRYAERTDPMFFLRNCRKIKALYTERQDI